MAEDVSAYRSGGTEPWTANLIRAFVEAKKPHRLLETGSYLGQTTKAMFEGMLTYGYEHGALLTTVEFDEARANHVRDLTSQWMVPQGMDGVAVEVVQGQAERFIQAGIADGSLDLVFLDDDHTVGHVYEELVALMPKMRPGGVILMHDVIGPFGLGEVCRRFGGVVLDLPRMHAAGGLGIITR